MDSKAQVLIADDDLNCRRTTSIFLTRNGFECDCAASAEEAIKCLQQNRYDLLLSDIEMPGNSDLKFIENLTQLNLGLPVILMTGYPTIKTAAHSVGLSVVAYLIKPVDPPILRAEVDRAVKMSRCFQKVSGTRDRLLSACDDLNNIENSFRVSGINNAKTSMSAFLDLTIQNVAASLLDLHELFDVMTPTPGQGTNMERLQSARPVILISALRETISVLAKTKSAFKSKELAELRHKLETLLSIHPENESEPKL
jgi:CheY-like chemotaxis protein